MDEKMTLSGFVSTALGALSARDLILSGFVAAQVVGGTLISTKTVHTILSPDQFDGPFLIGVATGALTAAEIEAAMENLGPSGPAHSTQTELSSRFRHIRTLGVIQFDDAAAGSAGVLWIDEQIKMGWAEQDGGYQWWLYNLGPALVAGSTWEVTERSFVIYDKD